MIMSNFTYFNSSKHFKLSSSRSSHWRSDWRDHFCTPDSYFGRRYLPCPKEQR